MPIERFLPKDKDPDARAERVYRIGPDTPPKLIKLAKARLAEMNPPTTESGEVPVGEPMVVPEIEGLPTRAQPPTAAGILLRGISALQAQLQAVTDQMLADLQSGRAEETRTLNTLGKGALIKMTAEDKLVAKPILEMRIKLADEHIARLTKSASLLERDMKGLTSQLSR